MNALTRRMLRNISTPKGRKPDASLLGKMRGKVLQGTAPAARGEDGQGPFRIDAEAARGITVNEHRTHLIHQRLFHAKMKFPDILGHVAFFRLIQSQFKVGAVSAAGTFFDADRASRVTPPERPQIVEDRIG